MQVQEQRNVTGTEEPGPPKRQRHDSILKLLERKEKRAEERDKRAEGQGGEAAKSVRKDC